MKHNDTILIVTYDEERYLLETLINSINTFLEPCNIVLLNADRKDYDWLSWYQWTESLKLLVPNHTLTSHIKIADQPIKNWKSWCYALKILGAELVTTPHYWVLDSKCFFYKPTKFTELQEQRAVNLHNHAHSKRFGFRQTVEAIEAYYAIDPITYQINTPPFRFNTRLAKQMKEDVLVCFDDTPCGYAEMLYYQAWCHKHNHAISIGSCDQNNSIVYPDQFVTINALPRQMKDDTPSIHVTGIHREILNLHIDEMTYQAIVHAVTGCRWKWDSNWSFNTLPNKNL